MHDMEHMRSGQWYLAGKEAATRHAEVRQLLADFNTLANTDLERSQALLRELFPTGEVPDIWPPLHLEFGVNTRFGPGCYMNFNCTILDIAQVTVGPRSLFGPGCQLITVEHPVADHAMRAQGWERARPITIGEDCWFGAGCIVLPGVTVGDRCVVAAGSVVTSDIPADSLAAGVPAQVKRSLIGAPLERDELRDDELPKRQ